MRQETGRSYNRQIERDKGVPQGSGSTQSSSWKCHQLTSLDAIATSFHNTSPFLLKIGAPDLGF